MNSNCEMNCWERSRFDVTTLRGESNGKFYFRSTISSQTDSLLSPTSRCAKFWYFSYENFRTFSLLPSPHNRLLKHRLNHLCTAFRASLNLDQLLRRTDAPVGRGQRGRLRVGFWESRDLYMSVCNSRFRWNLTFRSDGAWDCVTCFFSKNWRKITFWDRFICLYIAYFHLWNSKK